MIGKLNNDELDRIFQKHLKHRRPDVIRRSKAGEDVAVVRVDNTDLVLTTDPITAKVENHGLLVSAVNLNDLFTSLAEPVCMLLTILAPTTSSVDEIEEIIRQASEYAKHHNVEIVGGHTEFTDAVNRIIVSGVAIGKAPLETTKTTSCLNSGDLIYLTKTSGIEATLILASYEKSNEVFSPEILDVIKAQYSMMLSLKTEALISRTVNISAMHDVTEGGVLGAAYEMVCSSGLGANFELSKIPVSEVTRKLCEFYNVNPLRVFGCGSMLIAVSKNDAKKFELACEAENLPISLIGEVTDHKGIYIDGEELMPPYADEIYKVGADYEES